MSSCSPARLAANRANALNSTGPRTAEGKRISRRNGLKHGLTGEGVVLPSEDAEAVARRFEDLDDQFAPESPMGRVLVERVALLSVRMERGARQEAATLSDRVLKAGPGFDEARRAEAERLYHWMGSAPATNHRLLMRMPEGVDVLIGRWAVLRADLDHPSRCRWEIGHFIRSNDLLGLDNSSVSPFEAMTYASKGEFKHLEAHEGAGLDDEDRRLWARARLGELIDAAVAQLHAHRATLDHASIAAERAGAADRALFDPSKEAILARKYEAAAERGIYRALRELRQVEEEYAASLAANPDGDEKSEPLGSSLPVEVDAASAADGPDRPEPRPAPERVARSANLPQPTQPATPELPGRGLTVAEKAGPGPS